MPKVSVVIPVYNKEEYVGVCLKSALSQNFDDYEVIAVDDGSTDASGKICDEIAAQDSRLRVVHVENGGVTAARRRGVEEARGQYVMFCDSDDRLLPHALRNSYEAIIANDADEIIAPHQNQYGRVYDTGKRGLISADYIIQDFLALRNSFPSNWAILFRRSLLDGCLDIPRSIIEGEDILFHIKCLMKSPKVFCIAESNYVYIQGVPNTRILSIQHEMLYEKILCEILQPRWEEFEPWYQLYLLKSYENHLEKKDFKFCSEHYGHLRGKLHSSIPLLDRIAFSLPPRIAWIPICLYKRWLRFKA